MQTANKPTNVVQLTVKRTDYKTLHQRLNYDGPKFNYEASEIFSPRVVLVAVVVGLFIMTVALAITYRGGLPWNAAEAFKSIKAML